MALGKRLDQLEAGRQQQAYVIERWLQDDVNRELFRSGSRVLTSSELDKRIATRPELFVIRVSIYD